MAREAFMTVSPGVPSRYQGPNRLPDTGPDDLTGSGLRPLAGLGCSKDARCQWTNRSHGGRTRGVIDGSLELAGNHGRLPSAWFDCYEVEV